jgi:hypothetical protein
MDSNGNLSLTLWAFALTALLFQHLKPQSGTRIVTLASVVVHSRRSSVPLFFTFLARVRRAAPFLNCLLQPHRTWCKVATVDPMVSMSVGAFQLLQEFPLGRLMQLSQSAFGRQQKN